MTWDRKTVKYRPGQVVYDLDEKIHRQIDRIVSLDYEEILGGFTEPMYTFKGDVGFYIPESGIRPLYKDEIIGCDLPTGWELGV